MKTIALLALGLFFAFQPATQAAPETFEISGIVTDVRDKAFTIRTRGGERTNIRYTDSTKVRGKLRKGKRVTVQYMIQAREVQVW